MRINRLEVLNLRAVEQAVFDFQKGMNLLVGDNGAGKSVIIDALRASLSRILPAIAFYRRRPIPVVQGDIRAGSGSLTIRCSFESQGDGFTYTIHKNRTSCTEPASEMPDGEHLHPPLPVPLKELKSAEYPPLAVYYSTARSSLSNLSSSKGRISGGETSPLVGVLSHRGFQHKEFALWMASLESRSSETSKITKHLTVMRETMERFLPGCRNLRSEMSAWPRLVVDKGGETLDLRQLSGGEQVIVALVLDLARRLMECNPGLSEPVRDGAAVVLIDELELHLHPKRQRTIVGELTETFPNCQFIATTHSPQMISSVKPEQVFLLKDGEVTRPLRTLGMDSNWILSSLMEADERSFEATAAIEEVEEMMKEWELETARQRIAERRREGFDLPYWSVLEARMTRMEDLFEREP